MINIENLKEYYFLHRNKLNMLFISFILILILICGIIFYYLYDKKDNNKSDKIVYTEPNIEKEEVQITNKTIFVDIKGSVLNEGVYELNEGSRVIDLINLSGGLKEDANTRYINLSKVLNDADVVVIYSNSEIEKAKQSDIIYVETPCVCESVNDSCLENNINSNDTLLININTSSLEELMTLPGIGQSKGNSIINYRTKTPFLSIDDILNVDGISETVYEKIKELITV